jgi:halogenation protein CepH
MRIVKSDEQFDAIVVGGGPGGSTAATFVAMQGHRVLLLESANTPIYKIGESLLPSTIHGICNMLGVREEIERANFVRKLGGTFRWGKTKEPWTFAFSSSSKMQSPTSFAYQVERMKFDAILLKNAQRNGVDVRERHRALDLIVGDGGRVKGVAFLDEANERRVAQCRFVVDASGHSSVLNRHAGERVYSRFFRNVAVFGYYKNGKRLPAPSSGNIFCVAFDKGWFWYIPLSPTLTSVGAVVAQEYAHILQQRREAALSELILSCDPVRSLLSEATRVTEGPYGEVRVRKDYSYCHSHFWRPGLALVGDAACFIDPVFSSGVHLATYAALLAARSINTCLQNQMSEEHAFTEFEKRYRREYGYFYEFLVAFYDLDQDVDSYYWKARKVVDTDESADEAFINLVGGVAGSGEKLYGSHHESMQTRSGIGKRLFPAADGTQGAFDGENSEHRSERERFLAGLTQEVSHLQLRGTLKQTRTQESPLFADGLVPSSDGFHWIAPKTRPLGGNAKCRSSE